MSLFSFAFVFIVILNIFYVLVKDSTFFLEAGNNGDPFLRFQNGVWLIGTALLEA